MNELSERSAKHDSTRTFYRGLIRDVTEDKIGYYEHVIKNFERRYGMSFSDFSKKLEQGATIKEEDDWMEWEAAVNMLDAGTIELFSEITGFCGR
jgi:hypothetical protein